MKRTDCAICRRFLISLGLLLLAAGACNHTTPHVTRKAPDFALKDLEGRRVTLKDFDGKVVLLDFWATWCPPCRRSIPELVTLQERYRDRGLVILGISLDDPAKTDNRLLVRFKEKNRMNYPVLWGKMSVVEDYFRGQEMSIPTMFVIDRSGVIVDRHTGFVPGALEESLVKVF